MKIYDVTQELFSCTVFPGDTPPKFERVLTIGPDLCNLTNISLSVHNGTHIDAPNHFVADGKSIDELDLSIFYGVCTVVECSGIISEAEMSGILKNCKERLILKGDCGFPEDVAKLIARSHVKLIGVESQSVGTSGDAYEVHMVLLKNEIIPIEGLVLSAVPAGEYILSAFPLNLQGSDGSPSRVVLIAR